MVFILKYSKNENIIIINKVNLIIFIFFRMIDDCRVKSGQNPGPSSDDSANGFFSIFTFYYN